MLANSGNRDWWSVRSAGDESSQDGLAESRVGSSGHEPEETDHEVHVEVSAS